MDSIKPKIRTATLDDFKSVIKLIDNEFTKEGFGFVNRAQVETEIRKHRVLIAVNDDSICGVRIGIGTLWNLVVSKQVRGQGIGRMLVEYQRPHTIRVKSDPIGHLSNKQKESFVDPTGFYETLGYRFWGSSYPRNFWQRGGDKAIFHTKGNVAHIKVYKDPKVNMLLSDSIDCKGGKDEDIFNLCFRRNERG